MVQMQSSFEVADNSGAKRIVLITVLGQRKTIASIGDIVTATVKEAIPGGTVKKGDVVKAVVVRTAARIRPLNSMPKQTTAWPSELLLGLMPITAALPP